MRSASAFRSVQGSWGGCNFRAISAPHVAGAYAVRGAHSSARPPAAAGGSRHAARRAAEQVPPSPPSSLSPCDTERRPPEHGAAGGHLAATRAGGPTALHAATLRRRFGCDPTRHRVVPIAMPDRVLGLRLTWRSPPESWIHRRASVASVGRPSTPLNPRNGECPPPLGERAAGIAGSVEPLWPGPQPDRRVRRRDPRHAVLRVGPKDTQAPRERVRGRPDRESTSTAAHRARGTLPSTDHRDNDRRTPGETPDPIPADRQVLRSVPCHTETSAFSGP